MGRLPNTDKQWLSKNREAWKDRYGLDFIGDIPSTNRIEVLDSRTGVLTVRVVPTSGDRPIFLHSSVDPVREATRVVEGLKVEPGSVVVVYGFGLGYLVEALYDLLDESVSLFVLEPDLELFLTALKTRNLHKIIGSKRVLIHLGEDFGQLYTVFFRFFHGAYYRDLVPAGLPGHETVYADFCGRARKMVRDIVSAKVVNLLTMIKMGPTMLTSSILNLVKFYTNPGLSSLYGRFADVPAIIVAAGPSLNKNIHLLHEAKGKAVIFAVGTAAKALQKQGIDPDFIVTVDSGLPNYEHFKGIDTDRSCLIVDLEANYLILENYRGPMFVMGSQPVLSWFRDLIEDKGFTESGGSVANNAFAAAYRMGANPIIMIGQDLAFGRDGHSHAAGTNYENIVETDFDSQKFIKVKANDGGYVYTDRIYQLFLNFFEVWIKKLPDREYINATEGGAYIEGTEVKTFRETLDQYCLAPVDVQAIIAKAQESFANPDLAPFIERLRQQRDKMDDTIAESTMAIKRLVQLEKACESKQNKKMRQHLKVIRKIFQKFDEDELISRLPRWFSAQELHGVLTRTHKAELADDDDFAAAIADYTIYYEKVREGAEKVKELIEKCLQEAEGRASDAK